MNPAQKIAAGAAVVAVASGLPAITGYMLEKSINDQLEGTAGKYNYSVSSVSIDRSFKETNVDIILEGKNMRQLSKESLHISGTLKHGNIFNLPTATTADLDFTYYLYQEGIRLGLPGTAQGQISWNGNMDASLNTEALELPLDPAGITTMVLKPASADLMVRGGYDERKVKVNFDNLSWDINENNELMGIVSLASPRLNYFTETNQWNMSIPSLSIGLDDGNEIVPLTLAEIEVSGEQQSDNGLIQSTVSVDTGALTLPSMTRLQAENVVAGFTITSSVENVSETSISHLADLLQGINLPDNEEAITHSTKNFLLELTKNNPKVALDEFTLKTTSGNLSFSFDMEASEKISLLVEELVAMETVTPGQEDIFLMRMIEGLNTSARVTLSDDLLDWGCDRMGEQMAFEKGASPLQAQMVGSMCKTLAKSGDFLNVACMQAQNPIYQYQCVTAMNQAKTVWVEERSLELALKEGRLMLNGAALELPVSM